MQTTWLEVLLRGGTRRPRLTHTRTLPARAAAFGRWPNWSDARLVSAYQASGVERPWRHQESAAEAVWAGRHVCLATSTGSGKSMAFWLPALTAVLRAKAGRSALAADAMSEAGEQSPKFAGRPSETPSVLYLAPTKALAADQFAALQRLLRKLPTAGPGRVGPGVTVATCDGDTPTEERKWIQDFADVVLTNPDFLHFSLLPGHRKWARFLRNLRYVIVDEGHAYRGVFGAHVALVLRRLIRLVAHYRPDSSDPTFIVASATSADPAASAARLLGLAPDQVVAITEDASPAGERIVALWQPPEIPTLPTNSAAASPTVGWDLDPYDLPDPFEQTTSGARPAELADPFALSDESRSGPLSAQINVTEPKPAGSDTVPRELVGTATRRTATAESADLLADLTAAGARSLAFTRSRRGAESVALATREYLRERAPDRMSQVSAYRGGYLPEERRKLEGALRAGETRALATTNALELGVDISGLDAVLVAGWPGTLVSWWQQAGRAGRAGADGLVVFVAREDPLDTYLVTHPEALLDARIEATVFDPGNPYVLAGQLCAAAQELPLRNADLPRFGDRDRVRSILAELVNGGLLRRRPSGWYWTHPGAAAALSDLRGAGGQPIRVVDVETGRILGTVDAASADGQVHEGAVYVHQGETFVITKLDLIDHVAGAQRRLVDHGTWSREVLNLEVRSPGWDDATTVAEPNSDPSPLSPVELKTRRWGPIRWGFGQIEVANQVVSFERRRLPDMQVLGTEPLDLPERRLLTSGVWWTVPFSVIAEAGLRVDEVPGALHAAEHASIGLLPLLATCDRWDLGGLSTDLHPDTGEATVFVYDAYPGGAGFAERGFDLGKRWLAATLAAIEGCPCEGGCPSCIQSPKCGTNNSPLEKDAAIKLLNAVLRHGPP